MTLPGFGALPVSGWQDPAWLLLLAAPVLLLALYLLANVRRGRRLDRFSGASESVVPSRPSRWRHLPMALMLLALLPLTLALAQPSKDVRVPRNRAVIMLVIDVSASMGATDVPPTRLDAARKAAKDFARQVTPGVNLGLIAFSGSPTVLVSPSPQHNLTVDALDKLHTDQSTATGQAIFAALQAIQTVNSVLQGPDDTPPPARIVLLSDGKENKPDNPNNTDGAYTAARAARQHGVPITTIAFGTATGHVEVKNEPVPVPVDPDMMKTVAKLSGGQTATAGNVDELNRQFAAIGDQLGAQNVRGPASAGWLRLAVLLGVLGAVLAVVINRRLAV